MKATRANLQDTGERSRSTYLLWPCQPTCKCFLSDFITEENGGHVKCSSWIQEAWMRGLEGSYFYSVWECPRRVIKDTCELMSFRGVRTTSESSTQPPFMWVKSALQCCRWVVRCCRPCQTVLEQRRRPTARLITHLQCRTEFSDSSTNIDTWAHLALATHMKATSFGSAPQYNTPWKFILSNISYCQVFVLYFIPATVCSPCCHLGWRWGSPRASCRLGPTASQILTLWIGHDLKWCACVPMHS